MWSYRQIWSIHFDHNIWIVSIKIHYICSCRQVLIILFDAQVSVRLIQCWCCAGNFCVADDAELWRVNLFADIWSYSPFLIMIIDAQVGCGPLDTGNYMSRFPDFMNKFWFHYRRDPKTILKPNDQRFHDRINKFWFDCWSITCLLQIMWCRTTRSDRRNYAELQVIKKLDNMWSYRQTWS